ncbi:MAG: transcriptional regulator [Spirochaetaceae bacterium]|nr:transcriptional regulator [Spirochaetaceae bacterium]|tara:strand:- start:1942 stop:2238 length:297 start_codon:yes stop_codon:yes gene_type:complete
MVFSATPEYYSLVKKGQIPVTSPEDLIREVAAIIRNIRKEKGLSQEEVAGLSMSVRTFVRIEKGEVAPTLRSVYHIARGLGVQPARLFEGIQLLERED